MAEPSLMTRRMLIRAVAKRWAHSYRAYINGTVADCAYGGKTKAQTLKGLQALDLETCTAEEVNAVIGNGSWTSERCDGCGKDADALVTVGDEPDYESSTARLCRECCAQALALFPNEQ